MNIVVGKVSQILERLALEVLDNAMRSLDPAATSLEEAPELANV